MQAKKHIFTPCEKKLFLAILRKYSSLVVNNDNDGPSLRRKNEAWTKITTEYNASSFTTNKATIKQLRRLWINLKQRRKEPLLKEHKHCLVAGGGSSISDGNPDITKLVEELIPSTDNGIDTDVGHDEVSVNESMNSHVPLTELFKLNHTAHSTPQVKTATVTGHHLDSREREYMDNQMRLNEKHELEMQILREQLREAKAKADLAELILDKKKDVP